MDNNFLLIGLYFLIVLAIGWWAGKKETTDDFAIASRKVNFLRSTSSMFAVLGGVVLAGQATLAFTLGVGAMWLWIGLALGMIVMGLAAPKIKPIADKHNFLTIGEYFSKQWGRTNGVLAAAIVFLGFFSLLSAQFIVVGSVLGPFLNLSYSTVVLITGLIVLAYLLLGGYKAVIVTDLVQSILMIAVLLLLVSVVPFNEIINDQMNLFELDVVSILIFVILGIATVVASADLWQRVFSAQDVVTAKKATYASAALFLTFGFIITLIGIAAHGAFPNGNPDEALFLGIFKLVPEQFIGLSIVLLLAAIMSTIDTESFLLSSIIAKDFLSKKKLKQEGLKKIIRLSLVVVAAVAMFVAIFVSNILLILFGLISLIITISPAVFGSLFWKLKDRAVLLSLIGGLATLVVLLAMGAFSPDTSILTLPVAIVLLLIGQLIFRKRA